MVALKIAVGREHSCAFVGRDNGDVLCWGQNNFRQSSAEAQEIVLRPPDTARFSNVGSVAAGSNFSCAEDVMAGIFCAGVDGYGQVSGLGVMTGQPRTEPVRVSGLEDMRFIVVKAGLYHACGVTPTDELWCWGYNAYGQAGIVSDGPTVPVKVGFE